MKIHIWKLPPIDGNVLKFFFAALRTGYRFLYIARTAYITVPYKKASVSLFFDKGVCISYHKFNFIVFESLISNL